MGKYSCVLNMNLLFEFPVFWSFATGTENADFISCEQQLRATVCVWTSIKWKRAAAFFAFPSSLFAECARRTQGAEWRFSSLVTGASEREATDAGRQKSLFIPSHCFLRAAFLIRPRYFQSALPLDVSLSIGSAAASATDDVVCFADEPFPSSGNNQPSIFAFLPGPRTKGSARMKNSNNPTGGIPILFPSLLVQM